METQRIALSQRERDRLKVLHEVNQKHLRQVFEQKILARLHQRYADFGPTLAAEHLAKEGFRVSRETLRKWMTKAALWRPHSQRVKTVHVWRQRRASFGELVMQDSSPFRWLEERGPACQLIALIDDANIKIRISVVSSDSWTRQLRGFGKFARARRTKTLVTIRRIPCFLIPRRMLNRDSKTSSIRWSTPFSR